MIGNKLKTCFKCYYYFLLLKNSDYLNYSEIVVVTFKIKYDPSKSP